MSTEHPVTQASDRFEISVDGTVAGFTQFVERDGRRIFFHTEVGKEYGGLGLGGTLVGQALTDTIEAGLTVVPVCPFVKKYAEKHPELAEHVSAAQPEDLQAIG